MVHLLSNNVKAFSDNPAYAPKGITICAHVCKSQEHHKPKTLLSNLRLLFGLYQGSTQETTSYLGAICNLILRCKSARKDSSTPLINLIVINNLKPSRYRKLLDRYDVGYLDCSTKELYTIETELMLIEQHMGLVKPPPPLSAAARSVSEHGRPTPTPPQRSTTETSLYLSHKPFQDLIKALSEENKYFVCRNRHPKQGNCCPILEAGYLMIKDDKGVSNKLNRIPTGH